MKKMIIDLLIMCFVGGIVVPAFSLDQKQIEQIKKQRQEQIQKTQKFIENQKKYGLPKATTTTTMATTTTITTSTIDTTTTTTTSTTTTTLAETINDKFKDPVLLAAVQWQLSGYGIDGNNITAQDALLLKELHLQNKGIKDLSGLEYFTNLTLLDINNNPDIPDISVLLKNADQGGMKNAMVLMYDNNLVPIKQRIELLEKGVKLQDGIDGFVKDGQLLKVIKDASPYGAGKPFKTAYIPEVKQLIPWKSGIYGITDLSGLEYFTNLEEIDFATHPLSDLLPLKGLLKIKWLSLNSCSKVTDIQPLIDNAKAGGLGAGDKVELTMTGVKQKDAETLKSYGVEVVFLFQ